MPFAHNKDYKFAHLINVDETQEQSVLLDSEGFLNIALIAIADTATTFKVFVSNNAEDWILAYESPSPETDYIGKINIPVRFVKLVSLPAGNNGDKVSLSISAKP